MCGRCVGGVWEVCGRCVGGVWGVIHVCLKQEENGQEKKGTSHNNWIT